MSIQLDVRKKIDFVSKVQFTLSLFCLTLEFFILNLILADLPLLWNEE